LADNLRIEQPGWPGVVEAIAEAAAGLQIFLVYLSTACFSGMMQLRIVGFSGKL